MPNTEDLGIAFVLSQVAKMGFLFREQPKHDFGIDAHIEIADSDGKGTGRNIAVQIKSGLSYIKENEDGDIAYYTDERHIRYWAEHSLPVIIIIFHPEREIAWWCDVKAYISRHPSILFQSPYKIILPSNQLFTTTLSNKLVELATLPQSPLTLDRQHFSIITRDDISTSQVKRYQAEILVGNVNDEIIRLAIYQATEHLKTVTEHRSDNFEQLWENQKPHSIKLFIYRDLDDQTHTNWISKSIWYDANNSNASVIFDKPNDFTDDIQIVFADNQRLEIWHNQIVKHMTTKYDFVKKVRYWTEIADSIILEAKNIIGQRDTDQISEETYVQEMSKLAQAYTEQVEHKYDDGTTGPSEVRDAEIRFVGTIGSGGDILIAFTPRGLKTWTDQKRRNIMVKNNLKRYQEDREMLNFELKKLEG